MNDRTDSQLLRAYAEDRSEPAFAELVRRHVDFVHSAARRMVCDAHLAEDVTQGVFVALAKNPGSLTDHPVLSGWLHRTAQNIAAQTVRTDVRRRAREHEAAAMNELLAPTPDTRWEDIAPHLDAALGELTEADRDALLLRYFERKSAQEMAQLLGISDEAAQKRVSRAVERLRDLIAKRGVITGASGLVVLISAHAVLAAPAGLSAALATAALAGITVAATGTATIITMSWINAKSAAAILAAALVAGTRTYVVQQQKLTRAEARERDLASQQAQLTADRDAALAAAEAKSQGTERLRADAVDLARLRNEVTQLRQQLAAPKAPSVPPAAPKEKPQPVAHAPGSYIPKDQLAHVGYATPEAGLETITWAMIYGTYDQVKEGDPDVQDRSADDVKEREEFPKRQKQVAPLFQGMQIVAKKILSEDQVELKIKQDYDPAMSKLNPRQQPYFFVQKMIRIGNEWKLGGSTHEHQRNWETTGQVQTFTP